MLPDALAEICVGYRRISSGDNGNANGNENIFIRCTGLRHAIIKVKFFHCHEDGRVESREVVFGYKLQHGLKGILDRDTCYNNDDAGTKWCNTSLRCNIEDAKNLLILINEECKNRFYTLLTTNCFTVIENGLKKWAKKINNATYEVFVNKTLSELGRLSINLGAGTLLKSNYTFLVPTPIHRIYRVVKAGFHEHNSVKQYKYKGNKRLLLGKISPSVSNENKDEDEDEDADRIRGTFNLN